ncbi:GNAT family N-acetyltransferase [Hymenobacter koreensis]|uniref:GNAT family N-acetyltransferase n=1 Tax=Hymenobacter koreensis TaxID=1084523 RepID=A0ABP8J3K6_9BACT
MASLPLLFRPFEADRDTEAVVQLFRSNLDPYFIPEEEQELRDFIAQPLRYFVAEIAAGHSETGRLVAAGGYALNNPYAVLTWGMVDRKLHGQGLGRDFTVFRLNECRRAYPGKAIEIHTAQLTAGFYEKLGFRTLLVEKDKWAPGLDHCHMLLDADVNL